MKKMIYFDNAATTYPKPKCVYEAVNYAMYNYSFNAGRGSYNYAKSTFRMIEETRRKIGNIIGVNSDKVIFTSSATESINFIINGLNLSKDDYVFVTPFEHNAIIRTLNFYGVKIIIIPFDKTTWKLDCSKLNDLFIMYKPKVVFVSQVSNVTGYLLPYEQIFNLSKKYSAINVLDSAQSFGIKKIEKNDLDFVVFAGHKSLYGIFGIAGYINVTSINLKNSIIGGTGSDSLNISMPEKMPYKYEAGSPNAVAIYSLNKSLDFLNENNIEKIEKDLVQYFLDRARKIEKINIYLPDNLISEGIVSFNVKGYSADEVGVVLSEDYDICVRTGYHCAPLIHDFIDSRSYNGTIRVSFGAFNTFDEIDVLIEALEEL